jgi:hypothetical protein
MFNNMLTYNSINISLKMAVVAFIVLKYSANNPCFYNFVSIFTDNDHPRRI